MSEPISAPANPTTPPHAPFLSALERLSRSGFRSSEFWLVLFALAMLALGAWGTDLPPEVSCYLGTALVFGYKYFRAQIKATNGDQIVALADSVAQNPRAALAAAETAALATAGPALSGGADAAQDRNAAAPAPTSVTGATASAPKEAA